MLIYIVGYGRSGSTIASLKLQEQINCINLGEAKYIARENKNDLIDVYWRNFKKENKQFFVEMKAIQRAESFLGFFNIATYKNKYLSFWRLFFNAIGYDHKNDIVIDTSKTTLDSVFRPFLLKHIFGCNMILIYPKKPAFQVIKSLLKGKNSDIERNKDKSKLKIYLHSFLIGMPHFMVTEILTKIIYWKKLENINLKSIDRDLQHLIKKYNLALYQSEKENKIPIVYGNRLRNNYQNN